MKYLLVFAAIVASFTFAADQPKPRDMLRGPGRLLGGAFDIVDNGDGQTYEVRGPAGMRQTLKRTKDGEFEQAGEFQTDLPPCVDKIVQIGHRILTRQRSNRRGQ